MCDAQKLPCVSQSNAVVTKIILIPYVSPVIFFNGTTNYLTSSLQTPKILTFMLEILIIVNVLEI